MTITPDPLVGEITDPESVNVPENIYSFYKEKNKTDSEREVYPIAVIKQQLVSGINYAVLCRTTDKSNSKEEYYAISLIYIDLQNNIREQEFYVTDIETNLGKKTDFWSEPEDVSFPKEYEYILQELSDQTGESSLKPIALVSSKKNNGMNLCILCEIVEEDSGFGELCFVYVHLNSLYENPQLLEVKLIVN